MNIIKIKKTIENRAKTLFFSLTKVSALLETAGV